MGNWSKTRMCYHTGSVKIVMTKLESHPIGMNRMVHQCVLSVTGICHMVIRRFM